MKTVLFAVLKVMGLLPFNRFDVGSEKFYDYAIMFFVPVVYVLSYCLANINIFAIYNLSDCDSICKLGNYLFIQLGIFVYSINYAVNLLRRKKFYSEFRNRLTEIDLVLEGCSKKICVEVKEVQLLAKYLPHVSWIVVAGFLTYAVCYDFLWMFYQYRSLFFIPIMATTFPYLASSIVQGHFAYLVSETLDRFIKLNMFLKQISVECDKKMATIRIYDIENDLKHPLKDISAEKVKEEKLAISTSSIQKSSLEGNLTSLFCLHEKILTLSVITNGEYGLQVVPYMTVCFIISIFGIFLETKVIVIVGGKSPQLDYVSHVYVVWSLTTMTIAYLMLRLCCNANELSRKSATIVHEIMQKKPAFMLGNDFYYNKMKSFTLQHLHWEGYFQFNGVGLFVLDYTFIFSAVSAATSYLIVLLQFDMTAILRSEGLLR